MSPSPGSSGLNSVARSMAGPLRFMPVAVGQKLRHMSLPLGPGFPRFMLLLFRDFLDNFRFFLLGLLNGFAILLFYFRKLALRNFFLIH